MDSITATGIGLFVVGLAGYVAGIYIVYPGRAFSLTVIMAGLALAAIGSESTAESEP